MDSCWAPWMVLLAGSVIFFFGFDVGLVIALVYVYKYGRRLPRR